MKQMLRWLFGCLTLLIASWALPGCEPREDIITHDPGAQLSTSVDTVKHGGPAVRFDTVFVRRGSVTKRFWVYNRNPKAVRVDEIALVGAETGNSPYTLTIDGRPGPVLRDISLRGKDSLLVLVRVLIDPTDNDTTFLIQDSVRLRANGGTSYVRLRAFGENAIYYSAGRDSIPVTCNEIWRPGLPIVLLKTTLVDSACTLTIEPGTRVYVAPGASLVVKGQLLAGRVGEGQAPVRFQGMRREIYYANVPGQWGAIAFVPSQLGPVESVLANCDIRNATIAVQISNPYRRLGQQVRVESCVIRNAYTAGVFGVCAGVGGGQISLINTVITNVGQFAVGAGGGGTFRIAHCTIAPEGPSGFRRDDAALTLNDAIQIGEKVLLAPISLTVENSIIWSGVTDFTSGGLQNEIIILHEGKVADSLLVFRNSLLQTTSARFNTDAYYNPGGATGTLVLNQDPLFKRLVPGSGRDETVDLSVDSASSPALNIGRPLLPPVPKDILNKLRSVSTPDAGAY